MMRRNFGLLGLCLALFVIAAPSALAGADPKDIARQVCDCLREPHSKASDIMEKMKAAQRSGDFSKLMAMQDGLEGEMASITKAAEKCFTELKMKYPKVEADETKREEVNQIAEKMCPNPIEQRMSGRP